MIAEAGNATPQELDLALELAELAVDLADRKSPREWSTLALVYSCRGDPLGAASRQRMAIPLSKDEEQKAYYRTAFERYLRAAQ